MTWFGAFWHLLDVLTHVGPTGLLAGTAAAAGVLLAAVLAVRVLLRRVVAGAAPRFSPRSLRQHAHRVGVPRHRDPDASGRSRPRAPTAVLAAA